MTEEIHIGGDSAKFMSDGLTLLLENGQSVQPRVRGPGEQKPWVATWVDPKNGEVGLGPEPDDVRVVLYLSPAKAVFNDNGDRVWHYEWCGWLYCGREDEAFDYPDPGDVSCPHCGDTFHVANPTVAKDGSSTTTADD